ncbi:unnamed protein product [Bursaphelenchus okinawaensis]|uniref:UDP-galactose transporter n=1 Tax=Bursaphelenchus okinawaensis TaxID=465554 RepID=A0A811KVL3_9BILA|nr:unnamed protein product [Bursaphelenchus okinawaensis]CAG9114043.1 unnamed protein product [Bursaphelenchus okinawaensis]
MKDLEVADIEPLLPITDYECVKKIPIRLSQPKKSKYRFSILIWLSFHTAVHSLLLTYSRSRPNVEIYLPSVAVFFTEIIKAIVCLMIVAGTEESLLSSLSSHVLNAPKQVLRMAVPAVLYNIQSNLLYLAAGYIDPATFMILQQLKIFSSAVSSVVLLNRKLSIGQWLSLLLLFSGVCVVQISRAKNLSSSHDESFIGVLCVTIAAMTSGFAGVYMELQLKSVEPVSIWLRNIQMSTVSIPAAFTTILIQDGKTILSGSVSMTKGFDWAAWSTVFSSVLSGISVALCLKYADNIAKDFAAASAIILTTVGAAVVFQVYPNWIFCFGAVMVMCATYLFSKLKSTHVEKPKHVDMDEKQ